MSAHGVSDQRGGGEVSPRKAPHPGAPPTHSVAPSNHSGELASQVAVAREVLSELRGACKDAVGELRRLRRELETLAAARIQERMETAVDLAVTEMERELSREVVKAREGIEARFRVLCALLLQGLMEQVASESPAALGHTDLEEAVLALVSRRATLVREVWSMPFEDEEVLARIRDLVTVRESHRAGPGEPEGGPGDA